MNVTCPMCAMSFPVPENKPLAECPYCMSMVTVPKKVATPTSSPRPTAPRRAAPTGNFTSASSSKAAVYDGTLPYIFVSYAHKNSAMAQKIIDGLNRAGYRIWYDAGIEAGSEWPDYLAEKLEKATCVLVLISHESIASNNCRQEIEMAVSDNKQMLTAFLDDSKLQGGLRLRLSLVQAIFRSNFATDQAFINEIANARVLSPCKR